MGLDSQAYPSVADDAAEPVRRATTASMQNLLAQHLEAQKVEPKAEPALSTPAPVIQLADKAHEPVVSPAQLVANTQIFEPGRRHALSITAQAPVMRPEDAIAASFARLEAAFVAAQPMPEQVEAEAEAISSNWPVSAQALIESLMMENERLREQLHQQVLAFQEAQDQADSDVLTPTLNRRAFLREVQRAMADCKRYGEEACLIFLDMDSFKSINDSYGHGAGDAALIYVADTLKASVREGDAVGRMGGDEFAVLLRRADLKSSRIKAMKLEAELIMGTFAYNGLYLKTGGSFGVRAYANQATAEAWLSEADAAMFLVKKSSR